VSLSLLSYVEPDDPDRREVELRLERKWGDGSEPLIFSQRDFVERTAGIIPPATSEPEDAAPISIFF
jgi:hypothetical protein